MKHVIGIIGEAGCGKTTFANRLCDRHGFKQYGFARPLKILCCELFGWNLEALDFDAAAREIGFDTALAYKESPSRHAPFVMDILSAQALASAQDVRHIPRAVDHLINLFKAITPEWTRRRIMQWIGTDGFRYLDSDHWVKQGRVNMIELLSVEAVRGVVIPDMRFLNESAAVVQELGGKVVQLDRIGGFEGTNETSHSSEQEWRRIMPDVGFSIPNGIENVQERADYLITTLSRWT